MSRTIVITDGEQRAALALVRSLGRRGDAVHVCCARAGSVAGASRYARSETCVPDPLAEPDAFTTAARELLSRVGADTLIPVSEPSLLALLPLKHSLRGVVIPFPDLDTFRRICDKELVLSVANGAEIAVPSQVAIPHPGVAASFDLPFPVALKPARSVGEAGGRRVKLGVRYARDPAELAYVISAFDPAAFPVLAQQRIVGPGVGIFLLRWNGRILAQFAHRRIREKPPSGGVSVYRESIAADPELVRLSALLLERFDWNGVAMIEYKLDARTGTPYLMEINGRFWGSLQLAIDAGVDFPRLLLDAAAGLPVTPVTEYRIGVRSRWWWGDVDQLLLRLRRSAESLDLPPGEPGKLASLGQFLLLWRPGDRSEILRLGDPGPFVRESLNWIRGR